MTVKTTARSYRLRRSAEIVALFRCRQKDTVEDRLPVWPSARFAPNRLISGTAVRTTLRRWWTFETLKNYKIHGHTMLPWPRWPRACALVLPSQGSLRLLTASACKGLLWKPFTRGLHLSEQPATYPMQVEAAGASCRWDHFQVWRQFRILDTTKGGLPGLARCSHHVQQAVHCKRFHMSYGRKLYLANGHGLGVIIVDCLPYRFSAFRLFHKNDYVPRLKQHGSLHHVYRFVLSPLSFYTVCCAGH